MKAYIAIPAIVVLMYRAWSRQSLTPLGLVTAGATATIHALHPWSLPLALLGVFFLAGTAVTKVKHTQKASYTTSSTSGGGALASHHHPHQHTAALMPSPRGAAQVLCNSLPASVLVVVHLLLLDSVAPGEMVQQCLTHPAIYLDTLKRGEFALVHAIPFGIIAHYAAAAADTFSSELGILASSTPVLITELPRSLLVRWRRPPAVPRGTNGGVTLFGVLAGALGAALVALASLALLPFCTVDADLASNIHSNADRPRGRMPLHGHVLPAWTLRDQLLVFAAITLVGTAGSLLDSLLGALLQASVIDTRANKIVEGDTGGKVLYSSSSSSASSFSSWQALEKKEKESGAASRQLIAGRDLLSNNGVNLTMCALMSASGVGIAYAVYSNLSFYV